MADSYHIIDGKVVPYSGGRKCNDTDAWRDATPLELQLQEQLEEYEHAIAAKDAEIEALRAEVAEWKRVAAAQAGLHDETEARVKRLEKRLSAYQAAVNKIDDLIEYSLPMPSGTKAALYAVLANLTATIAVELTND